MEKRIGTVITGRNSSGVSDERKDIVSGESARRGNAPQLTILGTVASVSPVDSLDME